MLYNAWIHSRHFSLQGGQSIIEVELLQLTMTQRPASRLRLYSSRFCLLFFVLIQWPHADPAMGLAASDLAGAAGGAKGRES